MHDAVWLAARAFLDAVGNPIATGERGNCIIASAQSVDLRRESTDILSQAGNPIAVGIDRDEENANLICLLSKALQDQGKIGEGNRTNVGALGIAKIQSNNFTPV